MKIATIIGARPQFIKAAAVSRAIAAHNRQALNLDPGTSNIELRTLNFEHSSSVEPRTLNIEHCTLNEFLIHTGQHYDDGMSAVFFRELEIPEPKYNLAIGSGSHGAQTGQMLAAIEKILIDEKPDWVLIYGDTNSTLAGALAAAKLHIPIAHVEAGLRSFNRRMPEEINRIVADQLSTLLFCPSQTAVDNLRAEGIPSPLTSDPLPRTCASLTPHPSPLTPHVLIVGDVMADAHKFAIAKLPNKNSVLRHLNIKEKHYCLATIHRAENTDDSDRLYSIMNALSKISEKTSVVLPLHPRTKKILNDKISMFNPALRIIDPVGYFDIVALQQSALMILTDSGGMQKEAYWSKVPCITLRDETEWLETLESGWNILAGANYDRIIESFYTFKIPVEHQPLYGDGHAAEKVIEALGVRS